MNKEQKIKTYFNNKEIVREINNFISDKKIKQGLIKELKNQNIPIKELTENEKYFYIGNYVFKKNIHAKITIGTCGLKLNKVLFNQIEIPFKDIISLNENEFKTDYATYYIGED